MSDTRNTATTTTAAKAAVAAAGPPAVAPAEPADSTTLSRLSQQKNALSSQAVVAFTTKTIADNDTVAVTQKQKRTSLTAEAPNREPTVTKKHRTTGQSKSLSATSNRTAPPTKKKKKTGSHDDNNHTTRTKKRNSNNNETTTTTNAAASDRFLKRGKEKDAVMLQRLQAFRVRFPQKNCNVPDKWKEDPVLANWVSQQRRSYQQNKLPPERINQLNAMGFAWKLQHKNWYDSKRTDFDDMMHRLTQFYEKEGHANVPSRYPDDPRLAQWVKNQRTYRDRRTLEKSKIERLDALNFVWRFKKRNDWDEMLTRIIAFRNQYGHCNVKQSYDADPQLGKWTQNQRAVCVCVCVCVCAFVLLLFGSFCCWVNVTLVDSQKTHITDTDFFLKM